MKTFLVAICIAASAFMTVSVTPCVASTPVHSEQSIVAAEAPSLLLAAASFDADRWTIAIVSAVLLALAACAYLPKRYRSFGAFLRYLADLLRNPIERLLMRWKYDRGFRAAVGVRCLGLGAAACLVAVACFVIANKPLELFAKMPVEFLVLPVLGMPASQNRLRELSTNPTIVNFAQDASQAAIRKVANFLAPSVEVPSMTGQYKIFDAKHRYKRPNTRRSNDGRATRIGFTASDAWFNLEPNALDFPIPNIESMDDAAVLNYAKYGATLLADSSGLAHEGETIDKALAVVGVGTDYNFTAAGVKPIDIIDAAILAVKKLAKNGAGVKVLFGTTAFLRTRQNADTKARFTGGRGGAAAGGASVITPQLADMSGLLFTNPAVEMSDMVEDKAAEGLAEDIQFMLDTAIIVFASNDVPNTMDPSFMKTLRLMGQWMVPGSYESEDRRDNILKMDWHEQILVTNAPAAIRINANAA